MEYIFGLWCVRIKKKPDTILEGYDLHSYCKLATYNFLCLTISNKIVYHIQHKDIFLVYSIQVYREASLEQ